jgi:hypothetical protein
VFEGGEVWARTFAVLYPKVSYADEAPFRCICANVRNGPQTQWFWSGVPGTKAVLTIAMGAPTLMKRWQRLTNILP